MGDRPSQELAPVSRAGLPLVLDHRGAAPGKARVAIRPESIVLKQENSSGLRGTIRKSAYLGTHMEYTVESPIGSLFVVDREVSRPLPAGTEVSITLANHGVARRMAKLVVDTLQMIDVQHHKRTRDPITPPAFHFPRECHTKAAPIRQTSQRVQIRIRSQLIDLLSQRDQLLRSFDQQLEFKRQFKVIKGAFAKRGMPNLHARGLRTRKHERNAVVGMREHLCQLFDL